MAYKASRSDLFTGGFALLVFCGAFFVVLFLQTWTPKSDGARYRIRFQNAGGLSVNAPVFVAGQKVGKVENIDARPVGGARGQRRIEIEVSIILSEEYSEIVKIPRDTQATVQTALLFGGSKLVLLLGESTEMVEPGQRLPLEGKPPVSINEVVASAGETMRELEKGFKRIADVLNDDEFIDALRESMKMLQSSLERFDQGLNDIGPAFKQVGPTIENANGLLAEIRELIKANNENLTRAMKHLEGASRSADELLGTEGGVHALVADLNSIAGNLDKLIRNVNTLVLDNRQNLKVSMDNIAATTESLRKFARRIEADPSLLIWGGDEEDVPGVTDYKATPNIDEFRLRRLGRLPRRESD